MPDLASFTLKDESGERSVVTFQIDPFTALETITDIETLMGNLADAVQTITLCNVESARYSHAYTQGDFTSDLPAGPYADRERGIRIFFSDAVGNKGNITIAAPDNANMEVLAGTDLYDLTDTELAALVTLIEANVELQDGNAVTVDRAVKVGRNN